MAKKQVIVISHFNYTAAGPIHGPLHSLASYLQRKQIPYQAIAYPLYSGAKSLHEIFNGEKTVRREFGSTMKLSLPFKSLLETFQTFNLLVKRRNELIIAIDPLNALAAILLKKFGKASRVVFYTVDYTPTRFSNKALNWIYHRIDLFCVKNADSVWNVSKRIVEKRKEQGVPEEQNLYVPNAPSFKAGFRLPKSKVNRYTIMMVTGVTHSSAFTMVIDAISALVIKYSKLKLKIIGTGSYEEELKRKVRTSHLKGHVEFLGQLDHESLLKTLPRGRLGLAIYTTDYDWINFGDSMKAREYLLSGLPVIITDVVSTADDIRAYQAGIVVVPTREEIKKAIEKLLEDKAFWEKCRNNGIRLAKDFDMDAILDRAFLSLV